MRKNPFRATALVAVAAVAVVLHSGATPAQLPQPASFPAPARIAYEADADVYTIGADGTDRRRLTAAEEASGQPAWSPNGGSIAFVRELGRGGRLEDEDDDDSPTQIWTMRPDGADQRPYVPAAPPNYFDHSPSWSPNGEQIVFGRIGETRKGIVTRLIVTGPGGAGSRILVTETSRGTVYISSPRWSPDGSTILYSRLSGDFDGGEPPRRELYAVAVAGGRSRRIAKNASAGIWSPDGSRIAFTGGRGEQDELYVMNADGHSRIRLTTNKGDDGDPAWSGDGHWIAFSSDRNYPDGGRPELYSIRPDGTCLTWLTNGTARSTAPDWEPGASLPTDPGGCGATPREPLVETDASEGISYRPFPVYWLGRQTGDGLLLSDVNADGGEGVTFEYGDCGRYDPADCPGPVGLDNSHVCDDQAVLFEAGYTPGRVTRIGDGVLYRHPDSVLETEFYAGSTMVWFGDLLDRPPEPIVAALRLANGESEPGQFPLARFPLSYWHQLERVQAARRKLGSSAAAARRLRISRGRVKERLAIARRLRELGPFGRQKCAR